MNAQDKELALRIAEEVGSIVGGVDGTDTQCWTGDHAFDEDSLINFAHRYHTAKLEQESAEVVALREEVERLKGLMGIAQSVNFLKEHDRMDAAITEAKIQTLIAQAEAKKLRDDVAEHVEHIRNGLELCFGVGKQMVLHRLGLLAEALSTPINTTEIDALVKDAELYRTLREASVIDRARIVHDDLSGVKGGEELDAAIVAIKDSGVV